MTMKHCRCITRGRSGEKRNSDTTIFYNGPLAVAANLLHALGYLKLSSLGSSTSRTTRDV